MAWEAFLWNPEMTVEDLCEYVTGSDFPTGATIRGRGGIRQAYITGRGSIVMRARVEVEEVRKDRQALVVTAIPYQVNKRVLIERIADLATNIAEDAIYMVDGEMVRHGRHHGTHED